jgi:hypothetical protein
MRLPYDKLAIDIDVQHLEAEFGRYALLEATWSAILTATGQRSNEGRTMTCTFRRQEKIRAGYSEIVEGYQREIAALGDAIVAALTSPGHGADASCRDSH